MVGFCWNYILLLNLLGGFSFLLLTGCGTTVLFLQLCIFIFGMMMSLDYSYPAPGWLLPPDDMDVLDNVDEFIEAVFSAEKRMRYAEMDEVVEDQVEEKVVDEQGNPNKCRGHTTCADMQNMIIPKSILLRSYLDVVTRDPILAIIAFPD
ncbi:hypothetical protein IEQ34_005463 [Dendrobium chrysotoxum]|uniref:Uncharacterized protein n=1 Tax=Dendrobium chrysotoxum TaxID=161865 RepID=A0AAV7GU01_DENCH|nr:hypothetical protein IEQ34_005463 [Dendrobium chrysotoxum]